MKKHQSYWVLLFALLLSATMQAKVDNYIGAYAHLGEWSLLPSGSDYGASFGVAGGLGFLYELQAGPTYGQTRFLFDLGLGAQYGMTAFKQGADMTVALQNQTDLDGDVFDYIYEIQNRHDQYTNMTMQVPIMIGVQHRKFYMLAGVKLGANVFTLSNTTANINTLGRYYENGRQKFDDFRNMPDYQFFTGYKMNGTIPASLNFNVDAAFEIGGRFGIVNDAVGYDVPKRKIEYRLAAFVDYGLLDIHTSGSNLAVGTWDANGNIVPIDGNLRYNDGATSPVYNTTTMVDNLVMNDIMSTTNFADKVNNFMIGLKFTVLFQMPESGQCVICRDAYRSSASSRRGRLKYEE